MDTPSNLEEIETRLLSEAIFLRYGYDFRQYQYATIHSSFAQHAQANGYGSISAMIPSVLRQPACFNRLFRDIPVGITEMFRNPAFFRGLRAHVFPVLGTYPFLNIWHAGCASGEEAYSMAIMLKEEKLYKRVQIYATDINDLALEKARKGIYPLKEMQRNTQNYNLAGGRGSLGDYYHTRYRAAKMDEGLRQNITFAKHNLVTDGVFSETHLVVCKNVLIYFNRDLQNKVLQLLTDSLCHNGFLCLGQHESLAFTPFSEQYELLDADARIYRKHSFSR